MQFTPIRGVERGSSPALDLKSGDLEFPTLFTAFLGQDDSERFLISTDWNRLFPNSVKEALPNASSDHCPLLDLLLLFPLSRTSNFPIGKLSIWTLSLNW